MKKLKKEILRRVPEGMEIDSIMHSVVSYGVLEVNFSLKEKEVKLVKGEWYEIKDDIGNKGRVDAICFYKYTDLLGDNHFTGFNFAGEWSEGITARSPYSIKKANPKEVKQLLLKKAEEDYPEGTRVKSSNTGNIGYATDVYNLHGKDIVYAGACLYINGKWAEKVKSRFPDKTPVWCWDDDDITERRFKFWDAQNSCTFKYNGCRDGDTYDNYEEVKTIEPFMIEMQKNLK
jgi:hypothetical protein